MASFIGFSIQERQLRGGWGPALIALVLLSMFGCGGGGGGGGAASSETSSGNTISRSAIKGVLTDAEVSLYRVRGGTQDALLASTRSDAAGDFTLNVPAGEAGPFLVEIQSTGESRLRCAIPAGCDASHAGYSDDSNRDGLVNFGEFYSAPALTLTAIANNASELGRLSVTPLTHLATRYSASFPQGWDSLSIALAYSQLSNLLGLGTDITRLRSFDITVPASDNITETQWHYALLNAAFIALAQEKGGIDDLGVWLDQVAHSFTVQEGQLLAREAAASEVSGEGLMSVARRIAARANPTVDAYFARMLLTFRNQAAGELTAARPRTDIGNSTLDNVSTFLAGWRTWRSDLPLYASGEPFPELQDDYRDHIEAQWILTQILASASQYAPYAAVPDLVVQQICDSYQDVFYRTLCSTLIAKRTICLFPLAINGQSLCNYLAEMRLPLQNGLVATVDIFSQTAELDGTFNGQVVDLRMVAERTGPSTITMKISGSIAGERYRWQVRKGENLFTYDKPLSSTNFQLPDKLQSTLALNYSAEGQTGSILEGDINAKFNIALDPWRAIAWASDLATALPQVPMSVEMAGNFSRPFAGKGHILFQGGGMSLVELELPHQSPHNGLLAQVRLGGSVEQWQEGLPTTLVQWSGNVLKARYDPNQLTLENNSGMRLIMPDGNPGAGNLFANAQRYGRLYLKEDGWWIQLADHTDELL